MAAKLEGATSTGKGMYGMDSACMWNLLDKTGYLYGKIISDKIQQHKPWQPFFEDPSKEHTEKFLSEYFLNQNEAYVHIKECKGLVSKIASI